MQINRVSWKNTHKVQKLKNRRNYGKEYEVLDKRRVY